MMFRQLFTAAGTALILAQFAGAVWADTGLKRLTLRQDSLGWEAVGRVELAEEGYCSGALIATDLVLTAAHCLFDPRTGKRADPTKMSFRAGLSDGNSIAESAVARAVVHPEYHPRDRDGLRQLVSDVALLQLAQPIPAATAAPFFDTAQVREGDAVSVVSYAQGRSEALSWQEKCKVLGRGSGALMFSCDVNFGSSGAPVFDMSHGRGRIVSIISRGRRENGKVTVFGTQIAGPLATLKRALREGRGVFPKTSFEARQIMPGQQANGERRQTGARFIRP